MPYVTFELDAETHGVLLEYAAQRGVRVGQAVAELLVQALEAQDEQSPQWRLWRALVQARRRMQNLAALQQIAASQEYASEEEQAFFSALCAELGFDEGEVIRSATGVDFAVVKDDTTARAVVLLRNLLVRYGGELPARVAERELLAAGLSRAAIQRAREALGIESVRGSKGFIWRLPAEVGSEAE